MTLASFLRYLGTFSGEKRGQVYLAHVSHTATLWPSFLSPYELFHDIFGPKHYKDLGLNFSISPDEKQNLQVMPDPGRLTTEPGEARKAS